MEPLKSEPRTISLKFLSANVLTDIYVKSFMYPNLESFLTSQVAIGADTIYALVLAKAVPIDIFNPSLDSLASFSATTGSGQSFSVVLIPNCKESISSILFLTLYNDIFGKEVIFTYIVKFIRTKNIICNL